MTTRSQASGARRLDRDDLPAFLQHGARSTRSTPAANATADRKNLRGHIPGEPGLWLFILGDMTLFGVFFLAFTAAMKRTPGEFAQSAAQLNVWSGLTNTVVLLTSSFCVLAALQALGHHRCDRACRRLAAAVALGAVFIAIKVSEYQHLVAAGHQPTTDQYFTYYYVLTGIHLMHVVIGLALLCACIIRLRRGEVTFRFTEGAGSYWHMVDALWMVLFPLLYVVPAT